MWMSLLLFVLVEYTSVRAKDPELPLCPSNMQYFPQNLPMHCRMPVTLPPLPPFPPQMFQNPMQGKPGPFPIPLPGLPGPAANAIPSMAMPMPMMPAPQPPSQKLPVIVMPFYSPDTSYKKNPLPPPRMPHKKRRRPIKKRRPIRYDSSDEDTSDTDTSDDTSDDGFWKKARDGRRSNRHHSTKRRKQRDGDILTPVLQYVTKDGYVIFEKQISKGEAKDWLVKKNIGSYKKEQVDAKAEEDRDSNEDAPVNTFMVKEETAEVRADNKNTQQNKKKTLKRKPIKVTKQN